MTGLVAFEKPQKLIDRARNARHDVDVAAKAFFKSKSFTIVTDFDFSTGESVRKVRMIEPLPDVIEERLTDALNNTRNAFDQIIFAACKAIGKPVKDGHFPWATDRTDLDSWRLQNKKTGKETIPKEFWDILRRHEPYPRQAGNSDGNTLIRSIATLANAKHTIGIEINCSVASFMQGSVTGRFKSLSFPMPKWDPINKEVILMRWKGYADLGNDDRIAFYVVFDSTAPLPLRGVNAAQSITAFTDKAQIVLDDLKARAAALGAR